MDNVPLLNKLLIRKETHLCHPSFVLINTYLIFNEASALACEWPASEPTVARKHLALNASSRVPPKNNTAHEVLMTSHTYIFGGALPPFVESWGGSSPSSPPFRRHCYVQCSLQCWLD